MIFELLGVQKQSFDPRDQTLTIMYWHLEEIDIQLVSLYYKFDLYHRYSLIHYSNQGMMILYESAWFVYIYSTIMINVYLMYSKIKET